MGGEIKLNDVFNDEQRHSYFASLICIQLIKQILKKEKLTSQQLKETTNGRKSFLTATNDAGFEKR